MKITKAAMLLFVGLVATPAFADKIAEQVSKAQEQFQKGKQEDALKTLDKLVSQNPTSPEAHRALAWLHERMGNLDQALASAKQAVDVAAPSPARAEALATLASLELKAAPAKDALAHAEEAVKLASTPTTLAALERARARVGDAKGALQAAEQALQANAGSAVAHAAKGNVLIDLGRAEEAVAALRKALELDSKLTAARVDLSRALVAQNKLTEAIAEARKATEEDPQDCEAFAMLGTAIMAQGKQHWGDAIAQAQQGAFLCPKNPMVQVAVARIFEAGGNPQQAAMAYQKALATDPSFVPALAALVRTEESTGKLDSALQKAQQLAKQMPESGEAQHLLGRLLLRKNQFADAIEPLEKATERQPGNAEAHALLGTAYQFTGDPDKAAEAYGNAVKQEPGNVSYKTTYGLLLGVSGEHQKGVAVLKEVVGAAGYKDTAGWTNLGWIYRNMDPRQPEQAVQAYQKGLELDPKNAQAALGLGWAYTYLEQWDKSIDAFKRSVTLDAKLAGEVNNGIAWCYYFKQEMDQARAFAQKAHEAGRRDQRIFDLIAKYEKAVAEGRARTREEWEAAQREASKQREAAQRYEKLINDLNTGGPSARRRAVQELPQSVGAEAVEALQYALHDKDPEVRKAACDALGSLGGAARKAIPDLQRMSASIEAPVVMDKKQQEEFSKLIEVRQACVDALKKVQR